MSSHAYEFVKEIQQYDLDSYTAHLGWIAAEITTFKIYTKLGSCYFYLHDETSDRFFEFVALNPNDLKSREQYEKVLMAYFSSEIST